MNLRTLYANGMAAALEMSSAELYDLERAIKDDGQFIGARSGPGGGTPATPENVSLLVMAILMSPTKRNAGRRAKAYSHAAYLPPGGDPHNDFHSTKHRDTGQHTIGDHLAVIFALPKFAQDIDRVEADQTLGTVTIYSSADVDGQHYDMCDLFALPQAARLSDSPLRTMRVLSGNALRAIITAMGTSAPEAEEDRAGENEDEVLPAKKRAVRKTAAKKPS